MFWAFISTVQPTPFPLGAMVSESSELPALPAISDGISISSSRNFRVSSAEMFIVNVPVVTGSPNTFAVPRSR